MPVPPHHRRRRHPAPCRRRLVRQHSRSCLSRRPRHSSAIWELRTLLQPIGRVVWSVSALLAGAFLFSASTDDVLPCPDCPYCHRRWNPWSRAVRVSSADMERRAELVFNRHRRCLPGLVPCSRPPAQGGAERPRLARVCHPNHVRLRHRRLRRWQPHRPPQTRPVNQPKQDVGGCDRRNHRRSGSERRVCMVHRTGRPPACSRLSSLAQVSPCLVNWEILAESWLKRTVGRQGLRPTPPRPRRHLGPARFPPADPPRRPCLCHSSSLLWE